MNVKKANPRFRAAAALAACIALILGVIGLLQPLLDRALDRGTLLATTALAGEDADAGNASPSSTTTTPKGDSDRPTPPTTGYIFQSDPLATLTLAIQRRQQELDEREKGIQEREERFKILSADVEQKLAQLDEARKKLKTETDRFDAQLEARRNKDAKKWIEIYTVMQPDVAALVVETMDKAMAIELLSKMDPKKASKILDAMKREKAIELVEAGLTLGQR